MRPEVELWWLQAQEDLVTARHNARARPYAGAFFCQQALEKALKALFINERHENPERTHSLAMLGRAMGVPEPHLTFLRDMTPTFVTTRYPDAAQDLPSRLFDAATVEGFVGKTAEVLEWVAKRLQ